MRKLIPVILLILLLTLAACNSSDEFSPSPESDNGQALLNTDYDNALPLSSQLIIGSLQLEQTDIALDEEQAKTLLPLWQAYQALSNSDTTAQAELDAVLKQVQEGMQPAQIEAIAAMQLTSESAQQIMQELGIGMGRGLGAGKQDNTSSAGGRFPMRGGGIPGQTPGGGAGLFPGGEGQPDPEARATAIAERLGGGDSSIFIDRVMLVSLIRALETKTGEVSVDQVAPAFYLLTTVSDACGISLEILQAGLEEGQSLAEVITAHGGDLEAVTAALREVFTDRGLEGEELKQRVDAFLH